MVISLPVRVYIGDPPFPSLMARLKPLPVVVNFAARLAISSDRPPLVFLLSTARLRLGHPPGLLFHQLSTLSHSSHYSTPPPSSSSLSHSSFNSSPCWSFNTIRPPTSGLSPSLFRAFRFTPLTAISSYLLVRLWLDASSYSPFTLPPRSRNEQTSN